MNSPLQIQFLNIIVLYFYQKMCYAVNEAFIRLYKTGKIYRKERLVNWSCQLQSAISDIEVDHQVIDGPKQICVPGYQNPVQFGQLYQFAYKLSDSEEHILVSTTRPGNFYFHYYI